MELAEVLGVLSGLAPDVRQSVVADVMTATKRMRFIPQPGPQTQAYLSRADVLLYGGEPGGGKTALEVGVALNEHTRSLIVRRSFVDLDGVLHTLDNILQSPGSASGGNRPRYDFDDGKVIHFMGMGDFAGKQGNPHDLICIDEAAQLPEDSVRMLLGWLRTDKPGQRCRVIMGSNPPMDTVGDWLVQFFAPWLDDKHPRPAQPGELRWFLPNEDGTDRECEEGETVMLHGVEVQAQSRTFIRAKFTDNKYYDPEQYAKTLAALPASVRRRMMTGNFMDARTDDPWQVIPTEWVREAQARWRSTPPVGVPMCCIGVDVAQGGSDDTALAPRYDAWFAPLIVEPGSKTPGGSDVAGLVISKRRDNAMVVIDVGGGWGGDAHGHLRANQIDSVPYMGVKASQSRTRDNQLKFANMRSEVHWRFREALDPDQEGGSAIALPPDRELLSDLTAPLYEITSVGIKVEAKDKLVERLGRSPNRGDAVLMAWHSGAKMASHYREWNITSMSAYGARRQGNFKAILGHQAARRR